jgi:hypothetical protein
VEIEPINFGGIRSGLFTLKKSSDKKRIAQPVPRSNVRRFVMARAFWKTPRISFAPRMPGLLIIMLFTKKMRGS